MNTVANIYNFQSPNAFQELPARYSNQQRLAFSRKNLKLNIICYKVPSAIMANSEQSGDAKPRAREVTWWPGYRKRKAASIKPT